MFRSKGGSPRRGQPFSRVQTPGGRFTSASEMRHTQTLPVPLQQAVRPWFAQLTRRARGRISPSPLFPVAASVPVRVPVGEAGTAPTPDFRRRPVRLKISADVRVPRRDAPLCQSGFRLPPRFCARRSAWASLCSLPRVHSAHVIRPLPARSFYARHRTRVGPGARRHNAATTARTSTSAPRSCRAPDHQCSHPHRRPRSGGPAPTTPPAGAPPPSAPTAPDAPQPSPSHQGPTRCAAAWAACRSGPRPVPHFSPISDDAVSARASFGASVGRASDRLRRADGRARSPAVDNFRAKARRPRRVVAVAEAFDPIADPCDNSGRTRPIARG